MVCLQNLISLFIYTLYSFTDGEMGTESSNVIPLILRTPNSKANYIVNNFSRVMPNFLNSRKNYSSIDKFCWHTKEFDRDLSNFSQKENFASV